MSAPTLPCPGATALRNLTETPPTTRSAGGAARLRAISEVELDERNVLAAMKVNVDVLQSLLVGTASPFALDVLADLEEGLLRLEEKLAA